MKVRIISALVAAAIVIPLLLLGGYLYIIGVSIVGILAFKEMLDLRKAHKEFPNLMVLLALMSLIILILSNLRGASLSYGMTYQRILLVMLLLIVPTVFYKNDEYTTKDAFYLLGITLFLGFIFNLFIVIRYRGLYNMLYLISIPMFTDIFAYLGGLKFGKRKMCPLISPNKTWEGAGIGLFVGTLIGTVIYSCFVGSFSFRLILLTALLSIIGQIGDLVMSKIKRENDIKDFSNIMPGHGGILDRLDSLIFVIIAYVTFIFMI